jgi:hypothetical protein
MARATGLAEGRGAVSADLALGHDVGLAEQTGLHAAELDLMAKVEAESPSSAAASVRVSMA